jgi:cellulose synthase/poly-beta-1,6-N-acetylglucosamine synthase-like glycosyltransferase
VIWEHHQTQSTRNWRCCRYLNEYLVFGTSPETVRKVFQQRSRWCKGQMQVRQTTHTALKRNAVQILTELCGGARTCICLLHQRERG